MQLNFVNISICLGSELSCLLCDAAVETLMVCLIFTSVTPTQALSTCEIEGDILGDHGLYILCVCSVFSAGYFEEHVCFCDFFSCPVMSCYEVCLQFIFLNFLSTVNSWLCNVGQHWVKEIGAVRQFDKSWTYFRRIISSYLNLFLGGFWRIYCLRFCIHSSFWLKLLC